MNRVTEDRYCERERDRKSAGAAPARDRQGSLRLWQDGAQQTLQIHGRWRIKAYKREKTTLVDLNTIDALNESLPAFVPRSEQS
jgi:hypothetical protein